MVCSGNESDSDSPAYIHQIILIRDNKLDISANARALSALNTSCRCVTVNVPSAGSNYNKI